MTSLHPTYLEKYRLEFEAGPFLLTHAAYTPRESFGLHFHERPCVSVVLGGLVEKTFGAHHHSIGASSAVAMPPAEPHLARMGGDGARVLMIEPEDAGEEHLGPARRLFTRVTELHDARLHTIALRLSEELAEPDDVTPLAVDGLVREFLAITVRSAARDLRHLPPRWLRATRDLLHARFAERLNVGTIAREAGVHPTHFARMFRAHCGLSLGAYVRRLRVEWAALQLRTTDAPLCDIAAQAGFADQSHFTRIFRRAMGISPGRYRLTAGRERR